MVGFIIISLVWAGLDPPAKTLGFIWIGVGPVYALIVTCGFRKVAPALAGLRPKRLA